MIVGAGAAEAIAQDHALVDAGSAGFAPPAAALAVTLHVAAMLAVMGLVAVVVYEKVGVNVLRKAWINLDHLWAAAFVAAGAVTLVT